VAEPQRAERLDRLFGELRAAGLAVVRGERDAGVGDRGEDVDVHRGRVRPLVSGEVEAREALAVPQRERHRPFRRLHAVVAAHDRDEADGDIVLA
jgi:hypothetical protein